MAENQAATGAVPRSVASQLPGNQRTEDDEPQAVIASPAASSWIKNALESALERDPVDAVNDAEFLHGLLTRRQEQVFQKAGVKK